MNLNETLAKILNFDKALSSTMTFLLLMLGEEATHSPIDIESCLILVILISVLFAMWLVLRTYNKYVEKVEINGSTNSSVPNKAP